MKPFVTIAVVVMAGAFGLGIFLGHPASRPALRDHAPFFSAALACRASRTPVERTDAAVHGNGLSASRRPATAIVSSEPVRKRLWEPAFLSGLGSAKEGSLIRFELISGTFAAGTIRRLERRDGETIYVSGELTQPERGRFFFQKQTLPGVAGAFVGVVEFPNSERAYRLEPSGPGGAAELVERHLGDVLCLKLPRPLAVGSDSSGSSPLAKPADYPDRPIPEYQHGIAVLESLPGAMAVIYLDFQGGYTPTWGGVSYARPALNNAQIRDIWMRVAEDFMPFNLNVTTDLAVYEKAPENSRQRAIVTPTTFFGAEYAGVSYSGSFNWTGEHPCWCFLTLGSPAAATCSHEIGHTLGLGHDGYFDHGNDYGYFYGHGQGETGWAPLMGLGYAQNVSQWSRGEYLDADNHVDELEVITTANNNVYYRQDDTGEDLWGARYLELYPDYSAGAEGIIERSADTDAFRFTIQGGAVRLRADPVSASPNLALRVALYDSHDVLLASNNPQDRLGAELNTNLPAGTYTFRVSGAGRNDPRTNGFSAYASLGYYSVTGSVANAQLPERFVIPAHATNGTTVGRIATINPDNHPLAFALSADEATASTFGIDGSGALFVSNNHLFDPENPELQGRFPAQFELFVTITDLLDESLSESSRRVVITLDHTAAPALITSQPLSQTRNRGEAVWLQVAVSGDLPVTFQWLKDGVELAGQSAASLAIKNATRSDSGVYAVAVSNPGGTVQSSNAVVRVRVPQKLEVPRRLPDGGIALISGDTDGGWLQPGDLANFQVRATTNWLDWIPLTNGLSLTNGRLWIVDPQAAQYPFRFYQVLEY